MVNTPAKMLANLVKSEGSRPFITYYDLARNERVELSAKTFANWVAKTANFIEDYCLVDQPKIHLPVLSARPAHWVGLIWAMACWQVGGSIVTSPADISVLAISQIDSKAGDSIAEKMPNSALTVACSLHPFGLGCDALGVTLPSQVVDYAEVLSQPDEYFDQDYSLNVLADLSGQSITLAALNGLTPINNRMGLVVDDSGTDNEPKIVEILTNALLRPLLGGGSSVLISTSGVNSRTVAAAGETGLSEDALREKIDDICAAEKCTLL